MMVRGWLTITKTGHIKMTKTQTALKHNEVGVQININLPDALFNKPKLYAEITIPENTIPPTEITADVVEDCKEAIKQVTGLEMKISVIKDEVEDDV